MAGAAIIRLGCRARIERKNATAATVGEIRLNGAAKVRAYFEIRIGAAGGGDSTLHCQQLPDALMMLLPTFSCTALDMGGRLLDEFAKR